MATKVVKMIITILLALSLAAILVHHYYLNDEMKQRHLLTYHPLVPETIDYLLLFSVVLLSIWLKVLFTKLKIATNYCVGVLIIGFLLGIISFHNDVMRLMVKIINMSEAGMMFIYLPIMVFNVSFCLDVFLLVKTLPQIVVIGIFVSAFTAIIFGILAAFIVHAKWVTSFGLLFGVVSIPIYPKSITGLLKSHSTRTRQISVLLEGEALFTSVIADIAKKLVVSSQVSGLVIHWYQFLSITSRFIFIGILTGYIFGVISRILLKQMYTNKISIFVVCFAMPLFTYAISETYLSGCGSISVVVLGAMLGLERTILTKSVESFLVEFWDATGFVLDAVICFVSALEGGTTIITHIKMSDFVLAFGIYLSHYIVRFISFLTFSPIISRLGYGMDLKNMIMCVWCGLKGPYNVQIVGGLKEQNFNPELSAKFYFYILEIYFISILVNGTFVYTVMDFLGLTNISTARQINMNNCMKHLLRKRERTISVLKMDRFLVDSNWPVVRTATDLKHPYKMDLDEELEDNYFYGYRFTYCAECKKDVLLEPTPKELREMTKEARMRILKAKKMSYSRQYQNGMMSKQAIRILSQAIELAMDSESVEIKVEDLYERFTEETRWQRFIRNRAKLLKKRTTNIKPPVTYWRRLCYHLVVTSKTFEKWMLLLILINVGVTIYDILYDHSIKEDKEHEEKPDYDTADLVWLLAKIFFFTIYVIEFIIKILAYSWKQVCNHGFRTYFKSFWNVQDFIVIIIYAVASAWNYHRLRHQHYTRNTESFTFTIESLMFLRALRLLQALEIFYPDIIRYLDKTVENRMAFTYELGKSYATAEAEILDMLPLMIDNNKIRQSEQYKMEQDKAYITKLIGLVQKERPWIAITVKTNQAIKTILNAMNDSVNSLKTSGWVDSFEYDKINASMNELYKKANAIKKVQPSAPKVIFKEVPWMANDEAVIDFLFENVTAKKFEPGEIVFDEGVVADGIYIVVTGLFMITYTPDKNILAALAKYGRIPIVDYISSAKYQEPAIDYIVSGNCIGELSTLTSRAYNCVITADSHSQVYVLSHGVLHRAMELSPDPVTGLQCRIWKEVSVRIAIPLLSSVPVYQTLSQDQVKFALERAFVPDLTRFKIFVVSDLIEDIILIDGAVSDYNTRELYVAPCYIPRTAQKLILPTSSLLNLPLFDGETKLLIIPVKNVDEYDVMAVAEETCELVVIGSSNRCLQHVAQRRLKRGKAVSSRRAATRRLRSQRDSRTEGDVSASLGGISEDASGYTYFTSQRTETPSIYMAPDVDQEEKSYTYQSLTSQFYAPTQEKSFTSNQRRTFL